MSPSNNLDIYTPVPIVKKLPPLEKTPILPIDQEMSNIARINPKYSE